MKYSNYSIEDFVSDESFLSFHFRKKTKDMRFWEAWIKDHPEKQYEIDAAKELIDLLALKLPEQKFIQEREKIKSHISYEQMLTIGEASPEGQSVFRMPRKNYFNLIKAASIGLFVGLSAILYTYWNDIKLSFSQEKELAQMSYIEKVNPKGQKSAFFLKDGSKVTLNSESSIKFLENFGENGREIILNGEAFFEVTKDSLRPFVVKTQSLTTTALGTSFNIKAYEKDSLYRISLVSGKVTVQNVQSNQQPVVLFPGVGIYYNKVEQDLSMEKFNTREVLSWKDGTIYFKDATLDEILKKLERWYGMEFEVYNRKKKESKYTGEFHSESLENVLKSLGFAKNFNYKIEKRKVTIRFVH